MDNNVKNMFKNEIVGGIKSELVLDNKIKGVFGEVIVTIESEVKELFQQTDAPPKNLDYTIPIVNITAPMSSIDDGSYDRMFTYDFFVVDLEIMFAKPTKINQLIVDVEYWHTVFNYFTPYGIWDISVINATINSITADTRDIANNPYLSMRNMWTEPFKPYSEIKDTRRVLDTTFSNPQHSFSFTYSRKINLPSDVTTSDWTNIVNRNYLSYSSSYLSSSQISYGVSSGRMSDGTPTNTYPAYARITLIGTDIEENTVTYTIGSETNAHQAQKNTLVTTESMINGIPLYQHRANKIINEWKDGKQTVSLTKVVNSIPNLSEVENNVRVLNTREADLIDINRQSISRNRDGSAKVFKVDGAEFVYNGSYTQRLDISENKDGE